MKDRNGDTDLFASAFAVVAFMVPSALAITGALGVAAMVKDHFGTSADTVTEQTETLECPPENGGVIDCNGTLYKIEPISE